MKKIIIFEYLTSQQKQNTENSLLDQGIKMVDRLSEYLASSKKVKEINILRNENIKVESKKKVNYLFINKKNSSFNVLKNFDSYEYDLILIAPESKKIYEKTFVKLQSFKFNILNPSLSCIKKFSSKIKTSKFLKINKIPYVLSFENLKNLINKTEKYIVKPEYGAGSEKIIFCKSFQELEEQIKNINYKFLIQYFHETEIASISVLFSKTQNWLISCNQQIVKKKRNRYYQIGLNIGKFENYRKEFQIIVNMISSQKLGLFGHVGIDLIREDHIWKILEINPRFTSSFCYLEMVYGKTMVENIINFYLTGKMINKNNKIEVNNIKVLF